MATNDHDQGVEIHFCYDLSLPAGPLPVYVGICGKSRSLNPLSVTTVEGRETCKLCKRCLAKRCREAVDRAKRKNPIPGRLSS